MRNEYPFVLQVTGRGTPFAVNMDSSTQSKLDMAGAMLEKGLKAENPDYTNIQFSNSSLVRLAVDHLFADLQKQLELGVDQRQEAMAFAKAEFNRLCALSDRDPDEVLQKKHQAKARKKYANKTKNKGASQDGQG